MRIRALHRAQAAFLGILTVAATAVITVGGSATAQAATTGCSVTVNNVPVTMKVSKPGTSAKCRFTVPSAGYSLPERVTAAVTHLVTSDGSGCATLTLLAANGTTVDSSYNCNSVGLGPDTLAKGTYTLRLTLYSNTATGTSTLNVSS